MTGFSPALPALPREFFARDTHQVARELLGKVLVRQWRGRQLAGRITEVESYVGEDDAACHAARGRTPRSEVLFRRPGLAYVYLVYGIHELLNFVTEEEDFPAAVLIRALEPVAGIQAMQKARGVTRLHSLTTGPGKLTQAMRITRALNREDVTCSRRLYVVDDGCTVRTDQIATSPRIGVDYAGEDALLPWRYFLCDSPFISHVSRSQ